MMERFFESESALSISGCKSYIENFSDRPMPFYPYGNRGLT